LVIKAEAESALCAYNDYGAICNFRGIRSFSTFGGPWFCREHYYKMMGYNGMEGRHGNELPDPVTTPLTEEFRKQLKPRDCMPMEKYFPRVPGQDDEEVAA